VTDILVERCARCGAAHCPPRGVCRSCGSRELHPVDVSSRPLRVWSWTTNHQRWFTELEVPVVVVAAELADDPGVRLLGELRGADSVAIGDEVLARLERGADGSPLLVFHPVRR
jgi:uncharacterized OB-fold protein